MNQKKIFKKAITDRLSRAEGQIRALKLVIEEEDKQSCKEFITQVKAARSALKHVSEQYVLMHIHSCQNLPKAEREERIKEAVSLLASD